MAWVAIDSNENSFESYNSDPQHDHFHLTLLLFSKYLSSASFHALKRLITKLLKRLKYFIMCLSPTRGVYLERILLQQQIILIKNAFKRTIFGHVFPLMVPYITFDGISKMKIFVVVAYENILHNSLLTKHFNHPNYFSTKMDAFFCVWFGCMNIEKLLHSKLIYILNMLQSTQQKFCLNIRFTWFTQNFYFFCIYLTRVIRFFIEFSHGTSKLWCCMQRIFALKLSHSTPVNGKMFSSCEHTCEYRIIIIQEN